MTSTTEKITDNNVNFEIYADGDCVIHVDRPGFFQISQSMISKIYKAADQKKMPLMEVIVSLPIKFDALQSILRKPNPRAAGLNQAVELKDQACKKTDPLDEDAFLNTSVGIEASKSTRKSLIKPKKKRSRVKPIIESAAQPKVKLANAAPLKIDSPVNEENVKKENVRRSLAGPSNESKGWSCIMKVKNGATYHYQYANRRLARSGSPGDKTGENGRIS